MRAVNYQGYLLVTGAGGGGGGITNINVSAGTTSNNLSNLVFSNSNGVSFGLNGSTITAQHNGLTTAALSDHSHGASAAPGSFAFQTLLFSDANGISFGTSAGPAITASHNALTSQSNQAFSADASSTFQTLTFQNSNGVSFSNNAGALRVTHDLLFSTASRVINLIAATNNTGGGTASLSSNVSFSNANGATFYTSAGNAIVLSYTVPAAGAVLAISAAGNSVSAGTVVWSNSNNVSFGMNASTITATVTVPAQTNQSVGFYGLQNTTGQSSSSTWDARSLSFAGLGIVSVGNSAGSGLIISATQSNQAFSAGAASSTFQTLSFQDSNGLSFSNNAGAIRVSYTRNVVSNAIQSVGSATGSGTNTSRFAADDHVHAGVFSVGVSNLGNTAGDTRVDVGRFVFQGSNLTLSQITAANALNTVVFSAAAPGAAAITQTIGISNITQGGSTAGTTGGVTGDDVQFVFVPGSNITMSQSINGSSGTLSIFGPAAGGGATLSRWNMGDAITAAGSVHGNSSCSIVQFILDANVSASQIMFPVSIALASTTNTSSAGLAVGLSYVLYTRNASTLSSFNSGSFSTTSFHQSNSTTVLAGPRLLSASLATASLFAPGEYWMAVHFSTTSTGQTNLAKSISFAVVPTWASGFGVLQHFTGGNTTNTRGVRLIGPAIHSTGATRATIAATDITGHAGNSASLANLWFEMRNATVW